MIDIDKASKIISKCIPKIKETKIVSLNKSLFYVNAKDITSSINIPPFNQTAMDGFAVSEKFNKKLKIISEILPGDIPPEKIPQGSCFKVMTGSPLPDNCYAVIPVEDTDFSIGEISWDKNFYVNINLKPQKNEYIRFKAEDVKKNDVILKRGEVIKPKHITLLAACGIEKLKVYRQPKIGIISTGRELVKIGKKLSKGKIYDSNTFSIKSIIEKYRWTAKIFNFCSDDLTILKKIILSAVSKCDALITTGGVSVGKYDYLKQAIKELKGKIHFWKVAIKPGKPFLFATLNDKPIFALPGNPASCALTMELFVKPGIFKMLNCNYQPLKLKLLLGEDVSTDKDRTFFMRGKLINGYLYPSGKQGSNIITSYANADCWCVIPKDNKVLKAGSPVETIFIDYF